jgi:hypothetical protein
MAEVFFGPEKSLLLWLRDHRFGRSPGGDELFEFSFFPGRRLAPGNPLNVFRARVGLHYGALFYLVSQREAFTVEGADSHFAFAFATLFAIDFFCKRKRQPKGSPHAPSGSHRKGNSSF